MHINQQSLRHLDCCPPPPKFHKRLQQDRDAAEAARIAAPEGGKPQHRETAGDLAAKRSVNRSLFKAKVAFK